MDNILDRIRRMYFPDEKKLEENVKRYKLHLFMIFTFLNMSIVSFFMGWTFMFEWMLLGTTFEYTRFYINIKRWEKIKDYNEMMAFAKVPKGRWDR